MTQELCLPASTGSGLGHPGPEYPEDRNIHGETSEAGTLAKTLCLPDRGAEVGTDRQPQPKAPFLGSCTALLGAVTGRRGRPKAAFLEEVTLSRCRWGWAGLRREEGPLAGGETCRALTRAMKQGSLVAGPWWGAVPWLGSLAPASAD